MRSRSQHRQRIGSCPAANAFYQRVLEELASLPGVTTVGASNSLPIEAGDMNGSSFAIQSRPRAESGIQPVTMYQAVTAGYFETLGVPLIEGRFPTRDDDAQGRPVLWVNERFARDFLRGRAIGERIQLEDNWLEIVGVVGDIRTFGLRDDIRPMAYLPPMVPMRTVSLDVMQIVIRTAGAPAGLASSLGGGQTGLTPRFTRVELPSLASGSPNCPLCAEAYAAHTASTSVVTNSRY